MEHSEPNNEIKQPEAEEIIQESPENPESPETPENPETPEIPESPESQESPESPDSSVDPADEETIIEEKARRKRERRSRVWFIAKYVLVNVCRAVLAFTFLFSAFTKANDPVGLVIKLRDYAGALGMTAIPDYLLYVPAILLTIVETVLGI